MHAKRSFWWHLGAYILGNAALVAIWFFTSGGYFWPIWPALGWGIGQGSGVVDLQACDLR
ncbi:2TM domain-containing protein [Mycobacterium marinum]|uniref:2TM domain-containing protein n=1 Tax=Mycobacterium marinum TaxID=1781 RepID=UPI0030BA1456